MASLIKWVKDRAKNVQHVAATTQHGVSRGVAQVNPLDNGRTWQNNAPVQAHQGGVVQQATHNGATNFVGNAVVKPAVRIPINVSNQLYNSAVAPALGLNKMSLQQSPLAGAARFTGATGKLSQSAGDIITTGANVLMPGSSTIVKGAFRAVAPKVVPDLALRAIANSGVGAVGGGVNNIGAELSAGQIHNAKNVGGAFMAGARPGAVLGAGGTLAAPVLKAAVPAITKATSKAPPMPRGVQGHPDVVKANQMVNKVNSMGEQLRANNASAAELKANARDLARAQQMRQQTIQRVKSAGRMNEGGYIRLPGNADDGLVKKIFTKGTDDNALYHGTKYDNAVKILQSGKIKASKPNSSRQLIQDPTASQVSLSRQRNSGFYNSAAADVKFVVDNNKIGKTKGYVDGDLKPSDYENPFVFEAESQHKGDIPLHAIKRVEGGPLLEPADEAALRALAKKQGVPFVAFDDVGAMRNVLTTKTPPLNQGGYIKNPLSNGSTPPEPKLPRGNKAASPKLGSVQANGGIGGAGSSKSSISATASGQIERPQLPLSTNQSQKGPLSVELPRIRENVQTRPASTQTASRDITSSSNSTIQVPETQVRLNTARMNLSPAAQNGLSRETTDVIERLSNKDIQSIAKDAGLDLKTHNPEQTKKIIAEQLNVRQDAVRLVNEAEAARQSGDLNLAQQLLAKSAEQGRISRTQGTDLARQLQARRIIANQLDSPQQRIFKLLDAAGVNPEKYTQRLASVDFNDAREVVKAYRELVPAKPGEWLDTVRYNSMLSSPLTHIVNAGSNALNVGIIAPVEKTLRGVIDAAGGLFGHERQYAAGEGAAYAKGAVTNVKNAASEFLDAMRGAPQNFNLDLKEALVPLAQGGTKGAVYNTLSYPMRLLGASDKFFRTLAAAGEENALAARQAKGINIKGNIKELGQAEADYRLYQQGTDLKGQGPILSSVDSVTNSIMALRRKHTWAKFVFPFVKTPTNILKQGIEFSPLGYVNTLGAADKVTALTRASIGTAVFGAAWAMVGVGDTTWAEPTNPEAKNRFRAEGKQPYSIRIGGKWISMSKMPPGIAFPFALTSALNDAKENEKLSDDSIGQVMSAVAKYGEFLGDQSYVKNIGDTLGAFKGDPDKAVQAFSNYPQQVVPFRALTGWLARITDNKERKVNTDANFIDKQVQALMMNYPGLVQKVPTRNYRGAPIPSNNPVLNGFSPFRITDSRPTDPIDQAIDEGKAAAAASSGFTPAQTRDFQKFVAPKIDQEQRNLMSSPEYKALDAAGKKKALESAKTKVTSAYKRQYSAQKGIGQYASDYTGEDKPASKTDILILDGKASPSTYTTSSSGGSSITINPKVSAPSKKVLTDYSTLDTAARNKKLATQNDYEYQVYRAKYENDKANGSIDSVADIDRQKKLAKLEIGQAYSKEARDLFGKSKTDVYQYVTNSPHGQKLADELKAYDQALYDAGLIKYTTFQKSIAPLTGGGSSRTTRGGAKYTSKGSSKSSKGRKIAYSPRAYKTAGRGSVKAKTSFTYRKPTLRPPKMKSVRVAKNNLNSLNKLLRVS